MHLQKNPVSAATTVSETSPATADKDVINDSGGSTDSEQTEAFTEVRNYQEDNEIPTVVVRMLNLAREFVIFCVIMITYAALTKDPPKIAKPPAAYPFFPKDSIVVDWYRGQISKAIESARTSDIVFVMYYAPWDAQSQATRKEFELAANYMQNYVTFVAVNCWHPHSECRTQYSKVYRWPVLIAYPSHGRGLQYNGPLKSLHIIKFLKKVCNPLVRVFDNKVNFEDVDVIATLNTSPGSRDYVIYYVAALKYLEKDPQYRITFYVNSLAVDTPLLTLHLWNETLTFPIEDKAWTPDDILQWIFKNAHQVTPWVLPSGSKSFALSNNMQDGPTLILFTPRNPLHFSSDYYNMFKKIGQEYYNCDDNLSVGFQSVTIGLKRSTDKVRHNELKMACKPKQSISSTRKIISHLRPMWSNTSNCLHKSRQKHCDILNEDHLMDICSKLKIGSNCQKNIVDKNDSQESSCEKRFQNSDEIYKTSMLTGTQDPRSAINLQALLQKETCRQWLLAERINPAKFVNESSRQMDITGLSCNTNRSLILLAMDSLSHYQFAQTLGIDLSKTVDRTAAVIINDQMESHYILNEPVNTFSLMEFIANFTSSQLSRSFESVSSLNLIEEVGIFQTKAENSTELIIEELDTNSFLPTVLQDNKAVVVLYYTKQCSFCSGVSYVFLTAARKLKYVENLVFARVDGDINTLPWEYSMESYPTLLFFPANRKSDSRVYQPGIPINVSNLIGFILSNLEPNKKLQAMWSICIHTKLKEDKSSCYSSLSGETLSQTGQMLSKWRKSNKRQQRLLLHKLKQLRQLHLLFAHLPQRHQLILNYFKKLNIAESNDYHGQKIHTNFKDEL